MADSYRIGKELSLYTKELTTPEDWILTQDASGLVKKLKLDDTLDKNAQSIPTSKAIYKAIFEATNNVVSYINTGDSGVHTHSNKTFLDQLLVAPSASDNDLIYKSAGSWVETAGQLTYDGSNVGINVPIVRAIDNPANNSEYTIDTVTATYAGGNSATNFGVNRIVNLETSTGSTTEALKESVYMRWASGGTDIPAYKLTIGGSEAFTYIDGAFSALGLSNVVLQSTSNSLGHATSSGHYYVYLINQATISSTREYLGMHLRVAGLGSVAGTASSELMRLSFVHTPTGLNNYFITMRDSSGTKKYSVDTAGDIESAGSITVNSDIVSTVGELTVWENNDATTILGRARIDSRVSDNVYISHYDHTANANYGIKITYTGETAINSLTGESVKFKINNVDQWTIDSSGNLIGTSGNYIDLNGQLLTGITYADDGNKIEISSNPDISAQANVNNYGYDFIYSSLTTTGRTSTGQANFIRFRKDAVEKFRVDYNGHVYLGDGVDIYLGDGTTTSGGQIYFGDYDTYITENIDDELQFYANNSIVFKATTSGLIVNADDKIGWGDATAYIVGNNATDTLKLGTNSTDAISINSSQDVTIVSGELNKAITHPNANANDIDIASDITGQGTSTVYNGLLINVTESGRASSGDAVFVHFVTDASTKFKMHTSGLFEMATQPTAGDVNDRILMWDATGEVRSISGDSYISGSGTSGQVTYWNGTATVTGSANFTYDGTDLSVAGSLFLGGTDPQIQFGTANNTILYTTDIGYYDANTDIYLRIGASNQGILQVNTSGITSLDGEILQGQTYADDGNKKGLNLTPNISAQANVNNYGFDLIYSSLTTTGRTSTGQANFVRFLRDTTERFRVDYSGNIYLGTGVDIYLGDATTTSAGSIFFGDYDTYIAETNDDELQFYANSSLVFKAGVSGLIVNSDEKIGWGDATAYIVGNNATDILKLGTNNTDAISINSSQDVTIVSGELNKAITHPNANANDIDIAPNIVGQGGTTVYNGLLINVTESGRASSGDAVFVHFVTDSSTKFKIHTDGMIEIPNQPTAGDTSDRILMWDATGEVRSIAGSSYITSAVTSVSAGDGMSFTTITSTGAVTLGTPTTLTGATTNNVTATSHTHQIDLDLEELTNVTVVSVTTDEFLVWSGSAWINQTQAELGLADAVHFHSLTDITDVTATASEVNLLDLTTLTTGWVLRATGASSASWSQLSGSDINNDQSWTSNTGTVTSVGVSGADGIDVSGSPITTSGTITIGVNDNLIADKTNLTGAQLASGDEFMIHDADGTIGARIKAVTLTELRNNLNDNLNFIKKSGSSTVTDPILSMSTGEVVTLKASTSNFTSQERPLTVGHTLSSGTADTNFGVGITFEADSSTTVDQTQGYIMTTWTTATHASRTSNMEFWIVDNTTATEKFTISSSGVTVVGSIVKSGGTSSQFLKADGSVDSSTYLTGNQTITLSGDVSGSGTTAITTTIENDAVTYAKMQNVSATSRFLGRITAGAGNVEELTGTQATTLLDTFTSGLKGLAPSSGGGVENFLRADGTWADPLGGTVYIKSTGSTTVTDPILAMSAGGDLTLRTTTTNFTSQERPLTIGHTLSSGTADTNFGVGITFEADSSTTADQTQGYIMTTWTTATHASRTSNMEFWIVDNTSVTEQFTISSSGVTVVGSIVKSGGTSSQFLKADGSVDSSTYLTGNQTITLSGDVSGSGATAITTTIENDAVTYAKMQNVSATSRFLGRITAGAGDVEELTGTQATTLLDTFTSGLQGLAPSSGGGTTNFLRADGTWADPISGAGFIADTGETTVSTPILAGTKTVFEINDASTSTVVEAIELRHNTSGSPIVAGFGTGIDFYAETTTTEDVQMGYIHASWTDPTHASRASQLVLYSYYSGAFHAGVQINSNGVLLHDTVRLVDAPATASGSDEILLKDATGNITKLGIGTNLSVSGGNLNSIGGGSGDVTAGTQAEDQVAVWTVTAKEIEGTSGLTFNATNGLSTTGSSKGLTVTGSNTSAIEVVNNGAGSNPVLYSFASSQLLNLTGSFTVSALLRADDMTIVNAPADSSSADHILLRDSTTGEIQKLGIGSGLAVSGTDLTSTGVGIGGSIADNQVAVGSGVDTIDGSANLTWQDDTLLVQTTATNDARVHVYGNWNGGDAILQLSSKSSTGNQGITQLLATNEGTGTNTALTFFTRESGGSTTEKMRISGAGDVGIGTTTPQRGLHLETNGSAVLRLSDKNSTGTTDATAWIEYYDRNNTARLGYVGFGSNGNTNLYVFNEISSGDIVFHTNSTEQMKVESTGSVRVTDGNTLYFHDGTTYLGGSGTIKANKYSSTADNEETVSGTYTATKMVYQFSESRGMGYNSADDRIFFAMNEGVPMVIDNGGTVGIGTTAPISGYSLTIQHDSSATSGALLLRADDSLNSTSLRFGDTTSNTRSQLNFSSSSLVFSFSNTYGDMTFLTGTGGSSSERMRIESDGRVGIGTAPNSGRQVHILTSEVIPILAQGSHASYTAIMVDSIATGGDNYYLMSTADSHVSGGGNFLIYHEDTTSYPFFIDVTGHIGMNITDPNHRLHLHETDSGSTIIQFTNLTTGDSDGQGVFVGLGSDEMATFWNWSNYAMKFGTNNTERMRIHSGGARVSIGGTTEFDTGTYHKQLHIETTTVGERSAVILTGDQTSDSTLGMIAFRNDSSTLSDKRTSAIHGARVGNNNYGQLAFYTAGSGDTAIVERMRINSSGNIGFGTTDVESWSSSFDVIEAVRTSIAFASASSIIHIASNAYNDGSWKYKTASGVGNFYINGSEAHLRVAPSGTINTAITWTEAVVVKYDATDGMNMSIGASTAVTAGYKVEIFGTNAKARATDFVATSDRRLKENIRPYGSVLEGISKLQNKLYTYNRTISPDQSELGMIAQEVLPVFPDLVGGSAEQMYDISYMRLGAVALQGVAEVNYKVDKFRKGVKSEIDSLKERVRGLENENRILKEKLNI